MSLTVRPGGRLCFSLSAFSRSLTHSVYRYLEQRTLNFTTSFDFLILTAAQVEQATAPQHDSRIRGCCGRLSQRLTARWHQPSAEGALAREAAVHASQGGERLTLGVLPPRGEEEVLDLGDLLRLRKRRHPAELSEGSDTVGWRGWPTRRTPAGTQRRLTMATVRWQSSSRSHPAG